MFVHARIGDSLPNSIAIDCATYLKQYTGLEMTAVQSQSASLSITLMQRRKTKVLEEWGPSSPQMSVR
jgi:hypothetical protein